jgi:phage baseplate assembly protein W
MVTYAIQRDPDYRDLDLNLNKNRRSKDLAAIQGIDAVMQSIENLIHLNFYEKPFQPQIGSNVHKLLFDNITQLTSIFIENAMREVITNFEPRAMVRQIIVEAQPEKNGYAVAVIVSILNVETPVQIQTFLTRVR